METLHRDIAQRSVAEILPRGLLHTVNLAKRALIENWYRDLIKRSCQEISFRGLAQEVLPRDLF